MFCAIISKSGSETVIESLGEVEPGAVLSVNMDLLPDTLKDRVASLEDGEFLLCRLQVLDERWSDEDLKTNREVLKTYTDEGCRLVDR